MDMEFGDYDQIENDVDGELDGADQEWYIRMIESSRT